MAIALSVICCHLVGACVVVLQCTPSSIVSLLKSTQNDLPVQEEAFRLCTYSIWHTKYSTYIIIHFFYSTYNVRAYSSNIQLTVRINKRARVM